MKDTNRSPVVKDAPVWVCLVDDCELRGNGKGNVFYLLHKPALALMDAYEDFGIKGTFNIEMMQQSSFEKHADA